MSSTPPSSGRVICDKNENIAETSENNVQSEHTINWYAELNFFCFITFSPESDVTGIDDQELYDEEQENKFKKN